jgi:hypothetical protein
MPDIFDKAMDMVLSGMGKAAVAAKAKKHKKRDPAVEEEEHDGPHVRMRDPSVEAEEHDGPSAPPSHDELKQLIDRPQLAMSDEKDKDLEVQR